MSHLTYEEMRQINREVRRLESCRADRLRVRGQWGSRRTTLCRTTASIPNIDSPAERQFFEQTVAGGRAAILRNGWPDFMLVRDDGSVVGVEVKGGSHQLSQAQAKCFQALELGGIKVFVWVPSEPETLTPWRVYARRRGLADGTWGDVLALAGYPFLSLVDEDAFRFPEEPTGDHAREQIDRSGMDRQDGIG